MNLNVVILAAGQGKRMNSRLPKVLQQLGGKPLLQHVLSTARKLQPQKIHVVYGNQGGLVKSYFEDYDDINWVEQPEPLGTAHAVMQVLPYIEQVSQVLVLYGDVPLLSLETLIDLIQWVPEDGLNILSAKFIDPTGFGRIIRNREGDVIEIIEQKDATEEQLKINEINSGVLVTTSSVLRNYLPKINKQNTQGEYYLTDLISVLYDNNKPVKCLLTNNFQEVIGVNDKKQLAELERSYQKKWIDKLMMKGLSVIDPNRFDIRGDLIVGQDITVDVNVIIEGDVSISDDTYIGPNNHIKDTQIGKNVTIKSNCIIENAVIEDDCVIGPFARIRPGTYLAQGSRVGNFVEIKNSKIGDNTKINHLSYIGDTKIGRKVNVGAGTITCNYDGFNKNRTVVEDGVFIGSNTALVAPVTLAADSVIGAGSVITKNAPARKLTLSRVDQETIEHWKPKNKDKE